jgi:hypothetical protein
VDTVDGGRGGRRVVRGKGEQVNALQTAQRYLDYPATWTDQSKDRYETLYALELVTQADIWAIEDQLVWFRVAREEMKALQAAFEEMKFELDQYTDGWIISVYEDDSDYVNGVTWHVESGVPPILFMSDQLYDMYCKSIGMKNENVRPGKG